MKVRYSTDLILKAYKQTQYSSHDQVPLKFQFLPFLVVITDIL
jgi:hypothetical protein